VAQLHADATAAGGALQHHRVANGLRLVQGLVQFVQQAGAGQQRCVAGRSQLTRGVLQAEVTHVRGCWPDEADAAGLALPGKRGVLAEKTVARVDRLCAGLAGGIENAAGVQVGFRGQCLTDADGLVGLADMQGVGVGL
jgi:hypothetical protein